MNKEDINFTALDKLVRLDIGPTGAIFYGVLFFIFLLWGVIKDGTLPATGLAILIVFGVVYLIYKTLKIAGKNNDILFAFAVQNNFQFEKENKNINDAGSLYKRGHDKKETNIITGEFAGLPMKFSDYQYVTGQGKYSTDYLIRVMRLTLPRHLPHMVIDCEIESDSNGLSSLPITFDSSQKVELEGDFHKYFNLYVPDKYGVSALSIIAPDAMEALMRMKSLCDIEIIENQIYFYWPETDLKRDSYEKVFATVEEVMREIGDKLKSGDIFAHKTQADLHIGEAKNPIKLKKSSIATLLTSTNMIYLYIAVFAFGGMKFLFNADDSAEATDNRVAIFLIVSLAIVIGLTVYALYSHINKQRLKKELKQRYHS